MSGSNGQVHSDGASAPERFGYYGHPVIKPPTWKAYIPLYFFTGGLAGASATLALAARVTKNAPLARSATLGGFAALAVSPPLLVLDLRDKKRFMNMFRMFKVTSPMSVGTWLISVFGLGSTLAAGRELGVLPVPVGLAGEALAGVLGPFVSTYTAALIANTAVPIWHDAYQELPFLFAGGSIASAGALATATAPLEDAALARRLAFFGTLLEAASLEVMHERLGSLLAEPYKHGKASAYKNLARLCTVAGLALLPAAGSSRGAARAAGTLTLLGALAERFSVYEAGKQSARDPKYVVEPQRQRLEARGTKVTASASTSSVPATTVNHDQGSRTNSE